MSTINRFCLVGFLSLGAACGLLNAQDASQAADTGAVIARCQAVNEGCLADAAEASSHPECYALYQACMTDGGLP